MPTKTPDDATANNDVPSNAPGTPMRWQQITDTIIKFLAIVVSWPVIVLAVVLLVRNELPGILDELARRMTAFSMAGIELEFAAVREEIAEVNEKTDAVPTIAAQVDDIQQELVGFRESAALTPDLQAQLTETVTEFSEYLAAVGFDPLPERVEIEINTDFPDLVMYHPRTNVISIGFRMANNPDADTRLDAVMRGYAHHQLLTAGNTDGGVLNYTSSSIESGLAFYYPGSFTKDPNVGGWNLNAAPAFEAATPWAGQPVPSLSVGAMWGGAFWEMRTLLGPELTDRVLFDAWSANEGPGLDRLMPVDFVERVLESLPADVDTGDKNQVRRIFERRGFVLPEWFAIPPE